MIYPTISNYSTSTGVMPMLFALRDSIPFAFDALLLTIFFIIMATQYFVSKNKTSRGKILSALVSSSVIMVVLSMFLALAQLVTYMDVVFYAFLSIIFFAMLRLSDDW